MVKRINEGKFAPQIKRVMRKWVFALLSVFSLASCSKKSADCMYRESTITASESEIQAVENYLADQNITTAIKHPSGFYYEIVSSGSGTAPEICSSVSVTYVGKLTNGNIFDQTHGSPVTFILGELIPGWQKGIPLIKKGGEVKLYIPPSLGYGSQNVTSGGVVVVPANSILIFDVQLADVQ